MKRHGLDAFVGLRGALYLERSGEESKGAGLLSSALYLPSVTIRMLCSYLLIPMALSLWSWPGLQMYQPQPALYAVQRPHQPHGATSAFRRHRYDLADVSERKQIGQGSIGLLPPILHIWHLRIAALCFCKAGLNDLAGLTALRFYV